MKKQSNYKVVVVGNSGCGKTSLIRRLIGDNAFDKNNPSTVGVDFSIKLMNVDDREIQLQLWDVGGQERYGSMTDLYYKNSHGAVIVFDITSLPTFQALDKWYNDLQTKLRPFRDIPILVLGNKVDLIDDNTTMAAVTSQDLDAYIESTGIASWFPVSAKKGIGIQDAFQFLSVMMANASNVERRDEEVVQLKSSKYNSVNYGRRKKNTNLDDSCCID